MNYPEIRDRGTIESRIPPPSIEPGLLELRWSTGGIILPSRTFTEAIITDDEMVYKKHWKSAMHGDEITGVFEPTSGKGDYEEIMTIRLCSIRNTG